MLRYSSQRASFLYVGKQFRRHTSQCHSHVGRTLHLLAAKKPVSSRVVVSSRYVSHSSKSERILCLMRGRGVGIAVVFTLLASFIFAAGVIGLLGKSVTGLK